jgi:hypothetical protein
LFSSFTFVIFAVDGVVIQRKNMQQISTLAKGIEYKVRQLAEKLNSRNAAYLALEQQYQLLEKSNEQYRQSTQELEVKIQALKIANAIPKGKESADAKKKINELLRELDRCIDLLNNHPI